jgi:phospholipid/cholesterol/gamma-HCH transport system permease protein
LTAILRFPVFILKKTGRIGLAARDSAGVFFSHVYQLSELTWKTITRMPLMVRNIDITIEQMYIIGLESIGLVAVTSVFVGGETVVQAIYQFSGWVPYRYLGMVASKAMITELCPVITALVVASRISTAIAAEIGSMKTQEQLDAMACLSLDPIRYLIVPKTIACIVMMPVLVIFAELVAYIASIITAVLFYDVSLHLYVMGLRMFFVAKDLLIGIAKTTVFGAVIALTGSHFGFQTERGAEGVGEATTKAVMTAMMLILVFDFVIAFLVL